MPLVHHKKENPRIILRFSGFQFFQILRFSVFNDFLRHISIFRLDMDEIDSTAII